MRRGFEAVFYFPEFIFSSVDTRRQIIPHLDSYNVLDRVVNGPTEQLPDFSTTSEVFLVEVLPLLKHFSILSYPVHINS